MLILIIIHVFKYFVLNVIEATPKAEGSYYQHNKIDYKTTGERKIDSMIIHFY